MNKIKAFHKWYDEFFHDSKSDESSYSYRDVQIAFYRGWNEGVKKASK